MTHRGPFQPLPFCDSVITFFSSTRFEVTSRMSCSIFFPGMEVRLTGLQFPGSSLFPLLKIGVTLAFLQSPGTSPVLHDLSKMMESGLACKSCNILHDQISTFNPDSSETRTPNKS